MSGVDEAAKQFADLCQIMTSGIVYSRQLDQPVPLRNQGIGGALRNAFCEALSEVRQLNAWGPHIMVIDRRELERMAIGDPSKTSRRLLYRSGLKGIISSTCWP